MSEKPVRLGQREQQIVELLLQGCDNDEIARQLKMARRTVKAHFNRLFLRFGITGGIKRVKLATLLYREQLSRQVRTPEDYANSGELSSELSKNLGTLTGLVASQVPHELAIAAFNPCATDSGHAAELRPASPMKPGDTGRPGDAELLETWEHSLLGLDEMVPHERRTAK